MRPDTVNLLGLTFDNLNVNEVVAALFERPRAARFGYLVTPNADHLARLRRLPELQLYYDAAWLCVLDSRFIRRLAAFIGLAAPVAAPGADITRKLLANLSPQCVAIIGMSRDCVAQLQARYSNLNFIHYDAPQNMIANEIARRRARDFAVRANARFTFIALGSPLQEILAYEIARQPTATGTALCIGGALEFCAGTQPRAPYLLRAAGLEWLHRLACEPQRLWRRYLLEDPPVLWALLKEKFVQSPPDQPLPTLPAAISVPGPYQSEPSAHLQKILDEP